MAATSGFSSPTLPIPKTETDDMRILVAKPVNEGQQVDLEFSDGSAYRFHTAWIKDSHPNLTGDDYYRKSAATLFESGQYTADSVKTVSEGSSVSVHFTNGIAANAVTEAYPSAWLRAFAPYVGQPLNQKAQPKVNSSGLPGTGSTLDDMYTNRKPWDSSLAMPTFNGEELRKSLDMQIEFLEAMMDPGLVLTRLL